MLSDDKFVSKPNTGDVFSNLVSGASFANAICDDKSKGWLIFLVKDIFDINIFFVDQMVWEWCFMSDQSGL